MVELFEEVTSICSDYPSSLPKSMYKKFESQYKINPPKTCEEFLNIRLSKIMGKYARNRHKSHQLVQHATKWYYQQTAPVKKNQRRHASQITERRMKKDYSNITEESHESDTPPKLKKFPKSIRERMQQIFTKF